MTAVEPLHQPAPLSTGQEAQYLTFTVGDEHYGLDILTVQEIKGWTPVTPIPNTPPAVRGVLNLRGVIVPVIDLRTTFGMPQTECTKFTVVIIAVVGGRVQGLVVDAVADVVDVGDKDVQPPPDMGKGAGAYVKGFTKANDQLVVLLDLETLLGESAATALH